MGLPRTREPRWKFIGRRLSDGRVHYAWRRESTQQEWTQHRWVYVTHMHPVETFWPNSRANT